ncbi:MAG: response regulator transcription factor [Deltaproteobacteria bacterium]|nr:response regulator transcription factor [Deltaproteobacteria bacterium]
MANHILIVDDDAKLRRLLTEYLSGYGFQVTGLPDGAGLLDHLERTPPELLVLDVMLPGQGGLELLSALRQRHALPVIMLTAKGEEADRIVGLEMGADDYLGKPFNPRELLARIKAVLRRGAAELEPAAAWPPLASLRAVGLELEPIRGLLSARGHSVELSLTETKIMAALMSRPGAVFTRDELLNLARGRECLAFDRAVDVHISNLRAKLKTLDPGRQFIKTVWGVGYLLQES